MSRRCTPSTPANCTKAQTTVYKDLSPVYVPTQLSLQDLNGMLPRRVTRNIQSILVVSCIDKINTKVEGLPAKAEELLAQREKDVKKFMEQRNHMDTLIKMMKKVSESITGEVDQRKVCAQKCKPEQIMVVRITEVCFNHFCV